MGSCGHPEGRRRLLLANRHEGTLRYRPGFHLVRHSQLPQCDQARWGHWFVSTGGMQLLDRWLLSECVQSLKSGQKVFWVGHTNMGLHARPKSISIFSLLWYCQEQPRVFGLRRLELGGRKRAGYLATSFIPLGYRAGWLRQRNSSTTLNPLARSWLTGFHWALILATPAAISRLGTLVSWSTQSPQPASRALNSPSANSLTLGTPLAAWLRLAIWVICYARLANARGT